MFLWSQCTFSKKQLRNPGPNSDLLSGERLALNSGSLNLQSCFACLGATGMFPQNLKRPQLCRSYSRTLTLGRSQPPCQY